MWHGVCVCVCADPPNRIALKLQGGPLLVINGVIILTNSLAGGPPCIHPEQLP